MAQWKDFDQEEQEKQDQAFIRIGKNLGLLKDESIFIALERKNRLEEKGQILPIGQILLKMRSISIQDFMKIQEEMRKKSWTCLSCTTIHYSASEEDESTCQVCGMDQTKQEGPISNNNTSSSLKSRRLGNYEIQKKIAKGGMGTVYLAQHLLLKKKVALKLLHQNLEENFQVTRRFRREWELASSLNHPHIVKILDAGIVEGKHFYTMEYIEGISLGDWMKKEEISVEQAVSIIRQIALGLDYAHSQGVIHRDIKPANILVDQNLNAYITDFGIAKALEDTSNLTQTGMALGTLFYMSPEQANGEKELIGIQSDLYSLGVVFYQILSGKVPFQGKTYMEVLKKITHEFPPPPSLHNPKIDPQLEAICMKALNKDPKKRYQSGKEFVQDLDLFLQGKKSKAYQEVQKGHLQKIFSRVLAFLLVCVFFGGVWFWGKAFVAKKSEKRVVLPQDHKEQKLSAKEISLYSRKYTIYLTSLPSFISGRSFSNAIGYGSKAIQIGIKLKKYKKIHLEEAYFLRGLANQVSLRNREALLDYSKAISENPHFGWPYFFRSMIYYFLGEKEKSRKDFQRSLKHGLSFSASQWESVLQQWNRRLKVEAFYWDPKTKNFYAWGKGPGFPHESFTRKTPHIFWKIAYRPIGEVEWTYDFGEKAYSRIQEYLGIQPSLPRFTIQIERRKKNILGYTETHFGEIRLFAGFWVPFFGTMELLVQTLTSQFLYSSIGPHWPYDFWETQYGPFHTLLASQIMEDLNFPEIAQRIRDAQKVNPLFRLYEKWTHQKGWTFWKAFFQSLKEDEISFYDMANRFPWSRRCHYIIAYLSMAYGANLAEPFQKAGLGQKPYFWDLKWPDKEFQPYSISKKEINRILFLRKILVSPKFQRSKLSQKAWDAFRQGDIDLTEKIVKKIR